MSIITSRKETVFPHTLLKHTVDLSVGPENKSAATGKQQVLE